MAAVTQPRTARFFKLENDSFEFDRVYGWEVT